MVYSSTVIELSYQPVLRQQIIQKVHSSHMGIEGSLHRAREAYYWPLMNAEIRDFVAKCSICNILRPEECREELCPYELPQDLGPKLELIRLRLMVRITLSQLQDYYSNFIEMDGLNSTISKAVIQTLKRQFAIHGIPDILISDNGPQYSSDEFQQFARQQAFKHIILSPKHPQSNGKAESVVKTCKTMLKKAQLAKTNVYLALLDHRNTPTKPLLQFRGYLATGHAHSC